MIKKELAEGQLQGQLQQRREKLETNTFSQIIGEAPDRYTDVGKPAIKTELAEGQLEQRQEKHETTSIQMT